MGWRSDLHPRDRVDDRSLRQPVGLLLGTGTRRIRQSAACAEQAIAAAFSRGSSPIG